NAIYIEPISAPKSMAERGYTPEVSARRLRDAINTIVSAANTSSTRVTGSDGLPNVALHGDQPDIVVPTVGISLSTIATSIRGFLHIHKRQTISGEFTETRGSFQIRLRMDSAELFKSDEVGLEQLDHLIDTAAMPVVEKTHPYLAAAARWQADPDSALEAADLVIRQALTSVKDISAAYVLKGTIYLDRLQYSEAEAAFAKAIQLDSRNAVSHAVLSHLFRAQGNEEKAATEYRKATSLAKEDHVLLGNLLETISSFEEAADEYREAI